MKISEEWLKGQGWEISHYDIPNFFHSATKIFGKDKAIWNDKHQLKIFRDYEEPCDVYADVLIDNIDSVEKLQEALALCGVITTRNDAESRFIDKACLWFIKNWFTYSNAITNTVIPAYNFAQEFRKAMGAVIKENLTPEYDTEYLQSRIDAHTKYMQEHGITSEQQLATLEEMRGRELENPTNPWHKASEELPQEGIEVIGYRKDWIDEDFNPNGTRMCFYNEGQWTSAFWWDYQDTYMTINEDTIQSNPSFYKNHIGKTNPTHWRMPISELPKED